MAFARDGGVRHVRDLPRHPVADGTGATRQVLVGSDEAPHFALRRFEIAPGGGMPLHANAVEHEQLVLAGRARVRIGDREHEVEPGSVVYVPAGVPHAYRVVGTEPFAFLCAVPNGPDTVRLLEPRSADQAARKAPGGRTDGA